MDLAGLLIPGNVELGILLLQLAQQVARVIKEGMKLLGIDVPERM